MKLDFELPDHVDFISIDRNHRDRELIIHARNGERRAEVVTRSTDPEGLKWALEETFNILTDAGFKEHQKLQNERKYV